MIIIYRKFFDKTTYVFLSVCIPMVLLWSSVPRFFVSNYVYEQMGIYWSYRFVSNLAWMVLPGCGLIGALTTLKKKRLTIEDLFFNISLGLVVFLCLKVMQKHYWNVVVIIFVSVLCAVLNGSCVWLDERAEEMSTFKKLRLAYYKSRKYMVYLPILTLTPTALFIAHRENTSSEYRAIYSETTTDEALAAGEKWTAVTDTAVWLSLDVEGRYEEARKMALYFLNDLNVDAQGIEIRASKALSDGEAVAYYNDGEQCISINVNYLLEYGPDSIAQVVAHECLHAYDHQIIRELEALEEEGYNTNLSCYDEARALKAASESYREDSKTFEGYANNLLERRANEYAMKKIKELKEQGYFD